MRVKYIFITGGVCSSLGKGLTSAAIGMLLERRGLRIAMLKLDPYLNVDPGTMNPYQHGEVYVTDDGAETDLDLGHYFRYTNSLLSRASNTTSGQVYNSVIRRERQGDYLGKTVQVIPHITDEIKRRILLCAREANEPDVVIVEVGGTVGDIESLPFLEAIRQFRYEHTGHCLNIHLTYVPYLAAAGEVKTKPTQHSVQALREIGLFPDIMLCRSECHLEANVKDKISLFCNVSRDAVFDEVDVTESIYEVPTALHDQGLDEMLCERLGLSAGVPKLDDWREMLQKISSAKKEQPLVIGLVGKYVDHQDAYKSISEALQHGAIAAGIRLEIHRLEAEKILVGGTADQALSPCDGILVPGGFGERGWQGKVAAARYCRETGTPYFGICLGMQVLCIEFARHVAGFTEATSTEMDAYTKEPVISLLSEQKGVQEVGGTMRLGAYPCRLTPGTRAAAAYGKEVVSERHRHRYEFNNAYREPLTAAGLVISGQLDQQTLCEIVEVANHPWMVGVQFHPEFCSKPTAPHPLFTAFVQAALNRKNECQRRAENGQKSEGQKDKSVPAQCCNGC